MVQQTLGDIFKNYSTGKGIFVNKEALSHSYIPDVIQHREDQLRQLASILYPAVRGQATSNCFLYGKTGTGKTMVTLHVAKELQSKPGIKVLYVNCKMRGVSDTEYRLLAELCKSLGTPVPPTGLPTHEVYNMFMAAAGRHKGSIILILDEIDSLVSKIGDPILYNLTRIHQSLPQTKLTIVGISNSISFVDAIDPRVKSSLSEEEIIFPPYNSRQLFDILSARSKLAFNHGVMEPGVIQKCAALAAQEHGDARKAFDLLRIAAEIVERSGGSQITVNDVDSSENKLDSDRVVLIIKSQPKQSLAVLSAIIKLIDARHQDIQTGDIFTVYESICNGAGLKKLTQRRVSDLIAELDMMGIVNTRIVSKGRYGRSRQITIPLADSVLGKVKSILRENYVL